MIIETIFSLLIIAMIFGAGYYVGSNNMHDWRTQQGRKELEEEYQRGYVQGRDDERE